MLQRLALLCCFNQHRIMDGNGKDGVTKSRPGMLFQPESGSDIGNYHTKQWCAVSTKIRKDIGDGMFLYHGLVCCSNQIQERIRGDVVLFQPESGTRRGGVTPPRPGILFQPESGKDIGEMVLPHHALVYCSN